MRRTFLGMPAGPRLSEHMAAISEDARGVRWIPARNLHLTVEFLGPTRDDQLDSLSESLQRTATPPLSLEIEGMTCLPGLRRARVVAVRLSPSGHLRSLYQAARDAAEEAGFSLKPPRVSPHITVARLRRADGAWLERYLEEHSPGVASLGPYRADRLNLYESTLTPTGAEYSVLKSFRLSDDQRTHGRHS